jgi:hypothetical protein
LKFRSARGPVLPNREFWILNPLANYSVVCLLSGPDPIKRNPLGSCPMDAVMKEVIKKSATPVLGSSSEQRGLLPSGRTSLGAWFRLVGGPMSRPAVHCAG